MRGASSRDKLTFERWFALADLGCAAASGVLWWLLPQVGAWPLTLALLPWLARLVTRRFPFRRTPFDFFILLFLVSAGVAAWASYDPPEALKKLWILVGAVFLFYAVAGQPRSNFWIVCAFLGASAAGVAVYYLLTFDLGAQHPDLGFIDRLAILWAALRPRLPGLPPQANIAGGLIAMFAPFQWMLFIQAWKRRRVLLTLYALITGALAAFALLISSSRGAWLALGAGLVAWLVWGLAGFSIGKASPSPKSLQRQAWVFIFFSAACLAGMALLAQAAPGKIIAALNHLPGEANATSRLDIDRYSLRLVRDFPYTGGGLHAYAALFSIYMKVVPDFIISYAHDLYLDIAIEQGLPGLVAFLATLAGAAWLLLAGKRQSGMRGAVLAGLVVMLVHGLVDDPLYATRATPFLLVIPALALLATRRKGTPPLSAPQRNARLGAAVAGALLAAVLAFSFRRPLLSAWYADLGAVEMARAELVGFPTSEFEDGSRAQSMAPAEALFQKALEYDPQNIPANHRLGLISMLRRDFPLAQAYLEVAYAGDPWHYGVAKNLAYAAVWNGLLERAQPLLGDIHEGRAELEVYAWWWGAQGRPDLAARAEAMVERLK